MARILPLMTSLASMAMTALVLPVSPASAAGPFDGQWVIDAPAAGFTVAGENSSTCPALRVQFRVNDNQIVGKWAWVFPSHVVEASDQQGSSPVTGTIHPDGTIALQWESFHVAGKFNGDKIELNWTGECGPRVATGIRIG